jgi:TetR/AcrR family transcriptional regulator, cholesterol catabolism regulator
MAERTKSRAEAAKPSDRAGEAVAVALKLFLERGYDNTPMSLIAQELGLTKAGVYHHFESKEDLLYVIHRNNVEQLLLPVIEKSEAEADAEVRLRTFMVELGSLFARDASARILISEAKRMAPEHFVEIRDVWRRGFVLARDAIRELQQQGRCKANLNATFAAFGAIGMCSWITYWFDYSRPESGPEVAATLAEIFMNGVLVETPRRG